MRHTVKAIATVAVAAALHVPAAGAEQLPMTPQKSLTVTDQFYMSVGGTYQRIEMPRFDWVRAFTTAANAPGAPLTGDLTVDSGGPAVTVGYMLDGMPAFLGLRPRIELSGQFLWGIARERADTPGAGVYSFVGTATVPVTGPVHAATVVAKLESADVGLRFKSDFDVGSMVTLTPGIGLVGGFSRTTYDAGVVFTNAIGPADTLLVKINNGRIGGELGLDATFTLTPAFQLHAGVTGAMFRQITRMKANECFDFSPGAGCQNFVFGPAFTHASDRDNSWGYRVGASVGASYNWGWAQITVMGNAAFNGGVPGIDTPNPGATAATNPARISHDDRWSYGGYLMVSFSLN